MPLRRSSRPGPGSGRPALPACHDERGPTQNKRMPSSCASSSISTLPNITTSQAQAGGVMLRDRLPDCAGSNWTTEGRNPIIALPEVGCRASSISRPSGLLVGVLPVPPPGEEAGAPGGFELVSLNAQEPIAVSPVADAFNICTPTLRATGRHVHSIEQIEHMIPSLITVVIDRSLRLTVANDPWTSPEDGTARAQAAFAP